MKIAVSGKGGVGKTTFVAWLAEYLARQGKNVWLVDADTALSLGQACGLDAQHIPEALIKNKKLIEAKISPQEYGMMVLNPHVDDLPQALSVVIPSVTDDKAERATSYGEKRLLVMGGISEAGGGCACESNALLKALLAHLILDSEDWVLVDLEAGVEHLGRGTVSHVDYLFVITEPSMRSLQTAAQVARMAYDLRLHRQCLIVNKCSPEHMAQLPTLDFLPERKVAFPAFASLAEKQLHSPCVLGLSAEDETLLHSLLQEVLQGL